MVERPAVNRKAVGSTPTLSVPWLVECRHTEFKPLRYFSCRFKSCAGDFVKEKTYYKTRGTDAPSLSHKTKTFL